MLRFELLRARKTAKLTQAQLAERVGISRDKYSNIETGRQVEVDAVLAANIAKELCVPMEQIFLTSDEYKLRNLKQECI